MGAGHGDARPGAVAQFRLGGRFRRLHPRRGTRPPHPVDRQPADQAAGRGCRPAALESQRQGRDANGSRRTVAVVCTAAVVAGGRGARRDDPSRQRRRNSARGARGFRRLPAGEIAGGVLAHASGLADGRPRRSKHLYQARSRTRRTRSRAVQTRRRRKNRHRGVAGARALGHQQEPAARHQRRLGAADRFSHGMSVSFARHPCAGKRRPPLAHGLYVFQPRRHPGRGCRRHGPEYFVGDSDPGRPPRADGERRLCADRPHRSGAGGAPEASPATLRLAERLAEFCNNVQAKAA